MPRSRLSLFPTRAPEVSPPNCTSSLPRSDYPQPFVPFLRDNTGMYKHLTGSPHTLFRPLVRAFYSIHPVQRTQHHYLFGPKMAPARKKTVKIKSPLHRASSLNRKHSIRRQYSIAHQPPYRPSLIVTLKLPAARRAQSIPRQPPLRGAQHIARQLSNLQEQDTSTVASLSPPPSPHVVTGIMHEQRGPDGPNYGQRHRRSVRLKHEFSSAQLVFSSIIARAKSHGMTMESANPLPFC